MAKKGKLFENLGKNIWNGQKRGRCLRINYNKLAINYQKSPCTLYDYTLFRHGHLDNVKGGGFCNYHKSYLPLRVLDILRLNECLIFEVKLNGKSVILSTLYRSPSPFQFTDEFDNFLSKFEDNLFSIISKKPFTFFLVTSMNDSSSPKSLQIDSFTSHYGRTQVLNGTKYSSKICGR